MISILYGFNVGYVRMLSGVMKEDWDEILVGYCLLG